MVQHSQAARQFEPTTHYEELRAKCPLHHEHDHEPPFFVLSRFDDVSEVLKNPQQWQNRLGPGVFKQDYGVLGSADDPDHARQRAVLVPAFSKRSIEAKAPAIAAMVSQLLDDFVPLGEGDFVRDFAVPLPAMAIAEILGILPEVRGEFGRLADEAVAALSDADTKRYAAAKTRIESIVGVAIAQRIEQLDGRPDDAALGTTVPDDVLSRLTLAQLNSTITDAEARYLGYQLLVAGHETTTSLLGLMLFRLLERPAIMHQLRANRTLLPGAIEEALRFDSPVHGLFRTNAEPLELHGRQLEVDTKVQLSFASANRDPSVFSSPDNFVLGRDQSELGRHVAFGWGVHLCIGARLARLEASLAFEQIFDRMDNIELAGVPERNDSYVLHGLTSLPIRWTTR